MFFNKLFLYSFLVSLPSSKSLSYNWNFGSLLGMLLLFQIFTGVFLSFFYFNGGFFSFFSVQFMMYEINFGWVMRLIHFNGASFFFLFLFLHFFKGLFFFSYRLFKVWGVGLLMLLIFMMESFLGYVLVWAQMSFWASAVITSLLTVIPYFGLNFVIWVWGGFLVGGNTLNFFFILHFLLPWLCLFMVIFHLFFLHENLSTSKMYIYNFVEKVSFFPFFWSKDLVNFFFFFFLMMWIMYNSFFLGDPEMFLENNPMSSPVHIVPEWYFLFVYAILRGIPNKVLGVIFLIFSIILFFFFFSDYFLFYNYNKFFILLFFFLVIFLSWLGQSLVEPPFVMMSFFFIFFYFSILFFFNFF